MDECRRAHPVLHRLAHKRLWRYFPRGYEHSRRLFRRWARRRGLALVSRRVENAYDLDLTLDVAARGGKDGVIVCVAGTRGVDGYVGAAVQHILLRHLDSLLPKDMGLVLVHCANPFGMKMGRLVNENNVDLEHNVMDEGEFAERMRRRHGWNEQYAKVDGFMNPAGSPAPAESCRPGLVPALRSLWHWKSGGARPCSTRSRARAALKCGRHGVRRARAAARLRAGAGGAERHPALRAARARRRR